jgi:hypothetical protein
MNNRFAFIILPLTACLSFAEVARSLPDMTSTEMLEWFANHPTVPPLNATQKYEPGMSDFHADEIIAEGGTVYLSVFLNDQGIVEDENIDYRPDCYGSLDCVGNLRFERSDRAGCQNLITMVWGDAILEDFQNSTLVDTESSSGVKRWYEGTLYNYETWHYTNHTIAHFNDVLFPIP